MTAIDRRALNIADLREIARRRLPKGIYEFVLRGTEDDLAVRNNRAAFEHYAFRPRVLRDVSSRSAAIELFGRRLEMPLATSPTGAAGVTWYQGELALARAAGAAGIPFTCSTASLTSIEKVVEASAGPVWFQLYMWPDRSLSHQLVERVKKTRVEALIVTVDTAVSPNREYNTKNGFGLPFRIYGRNALDIARHPRWLASVVGRYLLSSGMPRFENYPEVLQQQLLVAPKGKSALPKTDATSWEHLTELRRLWPGPLLVKGILHPDDAHAAMKHGADGVVVSNHGGRNLDSSIPPLHALPDIVDRVGDRMVVLMDSGITRGSDIAKALALGAKAVMAGRAPLWGIAAAGEAGGARALAILEEELLRVMAFIGCRTIGDIGPDVLWTRSELPAPRRSEAAIGGTPEAAS